MAQKKSEFLKAWGKAFQIFKTIVDELLSRGCDADKAMELILTDEKVRKSVADVLANAVQPASETIPPQPILRSLGNVTLPATTKKFVANETFFKKSGIFGGKPAVKISYLGDRFKSWYGGKEEDAQPESILAKHQLKHGALDTEIIPELGGEVKAETTLADVWRLMERQPNGEAGDLLTNGYANIFYIRDVNGVLRAVHVRWLDGGWYVDAFSVRDLGGLLAGFQILSRNS